MSGNITFNENKYKIKTMKTQRTSEVSTITSFLLRKGIVKSEKTARVFLIIVSSIFLLTSIYVTYAYVFDFGTENITPEEIQENKERVKLKMRGVIDNSNNN